MSCIVCRYRWCWICGHEVDHWTHRISINPFSCKYAPKNGKSIAIFCLLLIAGLILLAPILFIVTFSICFYYAMRVFFRFIRRFRCLNATLGFIAISPLFICYFLLVVAVSAVLASLAMGGGIIPAIFLHIYLFGRTIYWWRRSRVTKMKADRTLNIEKNIFKRKILN